MAKEVECWRKGGKEEMMKKGREERRMLVLDASGNCGGEKKRTLFFLHLLGFLNSAALELCRTEGETVLGRGGGG